MDSQRFFIPFKPSESQLKIDFNDNIFLIGSCFSTEIHSYFIQSGFRASTHLLEIALLFSMIPSLMSQLIDPAAYQVEVSKNPNYFR